MKRFKYTDEYIGNVRQMKYATQEYKAQFENIARGIGQKYGYDDVTVEVTAFADFKMKWTRSVRRISFEVSDYMCGAPNEVVADLFDKVFAQIGGQLRDYSPRLKQWLTAKGFATAHRRTFLARHNIEAKKFTEFKNIPVHFAKRDTMVIGGASTLMRVITLNPSLKDEDSVLVEEAIKYQYNYIQRGLATFGMQGEEVEVDEYLLKRSGYVLN